MLMIYCLWCRHTSTLFQCGLLIGKCLISNPFRDQLMSLGAHAFCCHQIVQIKPCNCHDCRQRHCQQNDWIAMWVVITQQVLYLTQLVNRFSQDNCHNWIYYVALNISCERINIVYFQFMVSATSHTKSGNYLVYMGSFHFQCQAFSCSLLNIIYRLQQLSRSCQINVRNSQVVLL